MQPVNRSIPSTQASSTGFSIPRPDWSTVKKATIAVLIITQINSAEAVMPESLSQCLSICHEIDADVVPYGSAACIASCVLMNLLGAFASAVAGA